ncbi:MAG: aminotransferase class I/II-fold pyridoxal phosphate-dependent enzyme [Oscillospiraceae bacterium]
MSQCAFSKLSHEQAQNLYAELQQDYNKYGDMKLNLDMSRGKPCTQQLDLSNDMVNRNITDFHDSSGMDVRNYGELTGIMDMKIIFAQMLNVDPSSIVVAGNSSLNLMYDIISLAMFSGIAQSAQPWSRCGKLKFLCPSPGYDRHFGVTEHFGFELIGVPLLSTGPDMDVVEALVRDDESIKGMWCVPVFSNPNGAVYSDETVKRLASMQTKAKDFLIMCDNAYCVHFLYDKVPETLSIYNESVKAGNPDRVIQFASTSKITFAGAGVSCLSASKGNLAVYQKALAMQTIGFNKVNQLMHARFLKNYDNLINHMKKHADILRPKFMLVDKILTEKLEGLEIASWTKPLGGYFINFTAPKGTAKRIVELCSKVNVKLTPAGAAFPYGIDHEDSQIRIAPSYPSINELQTASELLCLCTKMASLEQVL